MTFIDNTQPVESGNFAIMWSGGAFEVFELRSQFREKQGDGTILRFNAYEVTDPYPIILNAREITARYDDKDEALLCAETARAAWKGGDDALKELQDEFDRKKKLLTERRDRYARDLAIAGREKIDAGTIKPMPIPLSDREIDREMEASYRQDAAVESALGNITEVLPPVCEFPGMPDSWYEKPVCFVEWAREDGDPSVGIPGWHGLVLKPDQTGTILGDILADLKDDVDAAPAEGQEVVTAPAGVSKLYTRLEAAEAVIALLTSMMEDQTSTHMRFESDQAAYKDRVRVLMAYVEGNANRLVEALGVWEEAVEAMKETA
ncbi:hypothetical protein HOU02_gp381 [Caulobacter phage CcrBL9]|uniref:Uncharacterized protein n=1 Tax=Caulobacter phage CcrBL9 TaxID=2283270 RepID=A0A385EBS9_9CAUD|nr:hypothetical protein HOU02_gp381 [Caulobacter phage CcrBL9]AXQ69344.1 hypothetical protein CcrBL9_gp320 [Caulobacter phage CcrBL9]